mmetsp:Transcript_21219/g.28597  ORF Transcript_21219/g.28597 Transcript_21219/m.28597 type:complete len:200 (+) Transcript_21219:887-1486(+)
MRSVSKPLLLVVFSLTPLVKWPGSLFSTPLMTFSSAPRRPRCGPQMMSISVPRPLPLLPLSPVLFMKNMRTPHSSSKAPKVARRAPVMYPMQSLGISRTVQSSRSSQPSTYTGPSSWSKSHLMYSFPLRRSFLVPEKIAVWPIYWTMAPEDRSSFLRVPPCLPSAYDSSSSWKVMESEPQVPESSFPKSRSSTSCLILL